jgi:hypothetical protein
VKEERVPSRSASASFRPSKKLATSRTESLTSTVERIVGPVPPAGGGAEPANAGEETCGTASDRSACFDGPPSKDFLQTVIPSIDVSSSGTCDEDWEKRDDEDQSQG